LLLVGYLEFRCSSKIAFTEFIFCGTCSAPGGSYRIVWPRVHCVSCSVPDATATRIKVTKNMARPETSVGSIVAAVRNKNSLHLVKVKIVINV
jgi:hypothetical protein